MGKLTECLKATKELRKQFVKTKAKKITKRDQAIIDAIENSDFGCKKESVYKFAEAMLERKISRIDAQNSTTFKGVATSMIVFVILDDPSFEDVVLDTGTGDSVYWCNKKSDKCTWTRNFDSWRPATDKEIKEYFA